jgi:hypothetical protein
MKGNNGHGAGEPYASPWKKRGKNHGQSEFQIADLDQAPLKLQEPSSHTLTQQSLLDRYLVEGDSNTHTPFIFSPKTETLPKFQTGLHEML